MNSMPVTEGKVAAGNKMCSSVCLCGTVRERSDKLKFTVRIAF